MSYTCRPYEGAMSLDQPVEARLSAVAEQLNSGPPPTPLTVRDFLWWWRASRRGYWVVQQIREDLGKHNLRTEPDFESAFLDSEIAFALGGRAREPEPVRPAASVTTDEEPRAEPDATNRLRKLEAANRVPTKVTPTASIQEVITLLLQNDFSQIPVMTTPREVKGVVTWREIGSRLALGQRPQLASEAMESPHLINIDDSIFSALPIISRSGYVLVQQQDRVVTGIVTGTDIADQFHLLTEPFLLLGEIENTLRRLIASRFSSEDLLALPTSNGSGRPTNKVADLSFGDYQRLLEEPARWAQASLPLDRTTFVSTLDRIRLIRNDVMHFDPDGIKAEDLAFLRDSANFFRRLTALRIL